MEIGNRFHNGLPGTAITIAGTGARGCGGDGGPAVQALLSTPYGLAVDRSGNLLVADCGNNRVRKIDHDGAITTVAGTGDDGFSGDGGPATKARLSAGYIALDAAGNLFIGDCASQRVRKVDPEGIITTVAGSGPPGMEHGEYGGDGGPATQARLNCLHGVAVDGAGNLYIADWRNHRVRRVAPDGIISTVAGNGTDQSSGDGGPAADAGLRGPFGVAVDAAGHLLIVEMGNLFIDEFSNRVRRVSPDGMISTVAGVGGEPGFSGDGGPAAAARLNFPTTVTPDSAGNLFVVDRQNHRVRKVSPDGIITTVAGDGTKWFADEGGPATATGLRGPVGATIDAAGNLFVTDSGTFVSDEPGDDERVLMVAGVAAPGLIAGRPLSG